MRCICGSVQAHVRVPREKTRNAVCYCNDCEEYRQILSENLHSQADLTPSSGVQIFKKDFQVTQGKELIEYFSLSPSKKLFRAHSKCCYTPLFLLPNLRAYPFVICNRTQFESDKIFGPVTWYFYAIRKWPDAKWPSESPGSKYAMEIPFLFFVQTLSDVLYGLIAGKGNTKFMNSFSYVDKDTLLQKQ